MNQNSLQKNLSAYLNLLVPQVVNGNLNRIEFFPNDLHPIVAERKQDILSLYHFVNGEIYECPYICIYINPKNDKAQAISYHIAEVQWYKNVNDYVGVGREKAKRLLNEMACNWLYDVLKKIYKNVK